MNKQLLTIKTRWVLLMIFTPLLTLLCSLIVRTMSCALFSIRASDFLAASIAVSIAAIISIGSKTSNKARKNKNEHKKDMKIISFLVFLSISEIIVLIIYTAILYNEINILPDNIYGRIAIQIFGFLLAFVNIWFCIWKSYSFEVEQFDAENTYNDKK